MFLYFLLRITGYLPFFVIYLASDFLFFITYYVIGYRKKVVEENLSVAFPGINKTYKNIIKKKFYRNLCDLIMETIKVQTMKRSDFTERVRISNKSILLNYFQQKTPVIGLTGHIGNHEWLGIATGIFLGYPVDIVYKPLSNKAIDTLLKETRKQFGNHLIPMNETFKEFLKRKDIVRLIAIVSDQTPPRNEIEYYKNFFNIRTPFYNGAQKLAAFTKYPVIFGYMKKIKRGYYEIVLEKLSEPPYEGDNNRIIDLYVERLEQVIRQYPDSWLWSHRRWKHCRLLIDD